jgi:hypothetical protein
MRTSHAGALAAVLVAAVAAFPGPAAPPDPADEQLLKDRHVPTDGPGLVDYFKKRTLNADDQSAIQALVRQLGDDDFDKREEASQKLAEFGLRAKPFLTLALDDPDAEVVQRARGCLRLIDAGAASETTSAAVRVLARLHPDGAAEALLGYLPSADDVLAEEVRLGLAELAVRDGKADPALVAALTDKAPARRAAAAFALCRGGADDQLPAIRKLLDDPDPAVRCRAALALAARREKAAVPVLIAGLDQLPADEASRVAAYLYRLADDKGPPPPADAGAEARRQYRDAWKKWWDDNGDKLDAARLEEADKTLGYTLVVLLDLGVVMELDAANHPRFQLDKLEFPLDAQMLPGDHVLVAEHNANRVTERTSANQVVWE